MDRSISFVNALVVLTDNPMFEDEYGKFNSTPENLKMRTVP